MKKIIKFVTLVLALSLLVSCSSFEKTTTHYKDEILWGMSPSEVSAQLGDLVIKETGAYIIAEDDESEAIGILASLYGNGYAQYNFNSDGKLYEISFEVKDPRIDYEKFADIVGVYKLDYNDIETDEISRTEFDENVYSEHCSASCKLDEFTTFNIRYIKHNGVSDDNGSINVSYRHSELYTEVLRG